MAFNPYESAAQFFAAGQAPGYVVSDEDKLRIQSYELYEKIYWTQPNTYQVTMRGANSIPIYLPSARKMIEACNRFLGVDFGWSFEAATPEFELFMLSLFKRERFLTKYATQKRYSLIRGDALWHIVADPEKPEGQRLSIYEVSPANYFPIMDPDNAEKRIGCYLVDIIIDPDDPNRSKRLARVQTYRKTETGRVTSCLQYYETNAWDARNLPAKDIKLLKTVVKEFELPEQITALPVYAIPANRIPGPSPFGYSELLGVERVHAAVSQAISDQDLALAIAGLGQYWTTAGPPKVNGQIVAWDLGPLRMLEIGTGTEIGRLDGITSVQPGLDHMRFMLGEAQAGLGVPDIAVGTINVEVAESGIARYLQLAPLLAKNEEKEGVMIEEYDRFYYDLVNGWIAAYEGSVPAGVSMVAVVGDPMPRDRAADLKEVVDLVTAKLLSIQEARTILKNKFGYDISPGVEALLREAALRSAAEDPFADRAANELDQTDETGGAGQENDVPTNGVPFGAAT